MHFFRGIFGLACAGCIGIHEPQALSPQDRASHNAQSAPGYPKEDAAWGRYHSKRFQLSFPLPDGKSWHIDDHSQTSLIAIHEATQSRLELATLQEGELVNHEKCEARARSLGWVPSATLATVDDQNSVGPESYDTRLWVALDTAKPRGSIEGHVYLFGASLKRCLLVHLSTVVPSANDEAVLSERLALASARVMRGLRLDPSRVRDDAEVPRAKPAERR